MKITYLITDLNNGGAEFQAANIIEKLTLLSDFQINVISLIYSKNQMIKTRLHNIQIQFIEIGFRKLSFNILAIIKLMNFIRKNEPEIIHSHMVHANFVSRFIRIFFKNIKVINTIHGMEEFGFIRSNIYRLTNKFMEYTTFCGIELYNYAKSKKIVSKNKQVLILNGMDINKFKRNEDEYDKLTQIKTELEIDDSEFIFINIGRLNKVKNQKLLIKSFNDLVQLGKSVKLLLIGEGPLENKLKSLVKKLKLFDKVIFLGFKEDIRQYLQISNTFVLTSIYEGLPLVLIEAISTGLPIITSDVGSCSEVIEDNGYLIKKSNRQLLFKAMYDMTEKKSEEIKLMKLKSLLISKKYDLNSIIIEWKKLYQKTLT